MWFIVVRVGFILECHRGHFPSCWHHVIGRKWGHFPSCWQNAWEQVRIRSTRACFDHISLIQTRNCAPFFFHGLLILQGKFCQNFIIFLNRLTGPQSFSLDRMHGSKSEFGALGIVLAISPSSDLGIMHNFFFMDS